MQVQCDHALLLACLAIHSCTRWKIIITIVSRKRAHGRCAILWAKTGCRPTFELSILCATKRSSSSGTLRTGTTRCGGRGHSWVCPLQWKYQKAQTEAYNMKILLPIVLTIYIDSQIATEECSKATF